MVVRISGKNLSLDKQLRFSLSQLKGIGKSNVNELIEKVYKEFNKNKKITLKDFLKLKLKDLEEETIVGIRNIIENQYTTESNLRRQVANNIKRLVDISAWRGLRHKAGMPTRGQTTRTNSRTIRGNTRKTGGSGKIKAPSKT